MTVIAFRDGIMVADSRATVESEAGGIRFFRCDKLFRVLADGVDSIVGVAGGSFDGLEFIEWLKRPGTQPSSRLLDGEADFTALMFNKHGLFEYDKWCRPEQIRERFYAVGCGAKAALTAMHVGASALDAVKATCRVDPLCGPPIVCMSFKQRKRRR